MTSTATKHRTFAKAIEALKELPVAQVVDEVMDTVAEGKVTILTAETGSGKTLLANSVLADSVDEQVVVLVPRRFLAINAAEAIAELGGLELGKEVGFAVGHQAGDQSQFSPDTKLLFATYGYALSSGLIDRANVIVADEVHEAGVDTSLARAILHKRLQEDSGLRVVEMSATLDARKQAAYWQDIAATAIHHAEGRAFPCEQRHVKPGDSPVEQTAIDLIRNEGRKGIAIFRPGVGEVEETAEAVRALCAEYGMDNVEVAIIYGDMDMEEREEATRPPAEGNVKVLIGTNVIESGVNIKWLDTGISDGKSKVPYYRRSGAEALVLEELPQWRIVQQEGRVKRFTDGIFVLNSDTPMHERPQQQTAEIERVSLTRLVMHAAGYGINPLELKYDAKVDKQALYDAKQDLKRLDLLTDDWKLTEKGRFVSTLPLGPEAGTMVYAAQPEIRRDAIELAAIVEVGGLRADYREPHGFDYESDVFDGLKAFRALGDEATEEECLNINVSWKRYQEAKGLIAELHRRQDIPLADQREATRGELTHVLLHGSVNRLFDVREQFADMVRGRNPYDPSRASVTQMSREPAERFAIGDLREVPTNNGEGRVIVQNITRISKDDLIGLAASREGVLTDISFRRNARGKYTFDAKYFGKTSLSLNIPQHPSEELLKVIEPGYSEFRAAERDTPLSNVVPLNAPQGRDNRDVATWTNQQAVAMGR